MRAVAQWIGRCAGICEHNGISYRGLHPQLRQGEETFAAFYFFARVNSLISACPAFLCTARTRIIAQVNLCGAVALIQ